MVGWAANGEHFNHGVSSGWATAFGTDWTEPSGGADVTTGTLYVSADMDTAITHQELAVSTTYWLYPYLDRAVDNRITMPYAFSAKNVSRATTQHADGHAPLSVGAISFTTPATGLTGTAT